MHVKSKPIVTEIASISSFTITFNLHQCLLLSSDRDLEYYRKMLYRLSGSSSTYTKWLKESGKHAVEINWDMLAQSECRDFIFKPNTSRVLTAHPATRSATASASNSDPAFSSLLAVLQQLAREDQSLIPPPNSVSSFTEDIVIDLQQISDERLDLMKHLPSYEHHIDGYSFPATDSRLQTQHIVAGLRAVINDQLIPYIGFRLPCKQICYLQCVSSPLLVVRLNRALGSSQQSARLDNRPFRVPMGKFSLTTQCLDFVLYAFVAYKPLGNGQAGINKGHYISYVRKSHEFLGSKHRNWSRYNDHIVDELTDEQVSTLFDGKTRFGTQDNPFVPTLLFFLKV